MYKKNYILYYLLLGIDILGMIMFCYGTIVNGVSISRLNWAGDLGSGTLVLRKDKLYVESKVDGHLFYYRLNFSDPCVGIGDRVKVIYERANPANGRMNSFKELYLSFIIGIIVTTAFLVIAFLIVRYKDWILKQEGGAWPYG